MPGFASSRLMWARLRPNAAALMALVLLPVAAVLLWGMGSRDGARWVQVLVLGWLLVSVLPAALLGRMERSVLARWKSLPVSTGEHWLGAYVALLPVSLIAGALLTVGAWLTGPASYQHPLLLAVGAVAVGAMVSLGLAVAAWSDSEWTLAGLLGLVLLVCAIPLFPGAPDMMMQLVPTGQARLALGALTTAAHGGAFDLLKLVMTGAFFMIVGILGERRQ
jgi:hypothetical protein